jgi:hypothetical protein
MVRRYAPAGLVQPLDLAVQSHQEPDVRRAHGHQKRPPCPRPEDCGEGWRISPRQRHACRGHARHGHQKIDRTPYHPNRTVGQPRARAKPACQGWMPCLSSRTMWRCAAEMKPKARKAIVPTIRTSKSVDPSGGGGADFKT